MEEDLRSFERREWPSSLCGNSPRTWCERIDVVVVIIVVSSSGVVGWVAISTSSVSIGFVTSVVVPPPTSSYLHSLEPDAISVSEMHWTRSVTPTRVFALTGNIEIDVAEGGGGMERKEHVSTGFHATRMYW